MNHLSTMGAARRPDLRPVFALALLALLAACGGGDDDTAARASPQGGIGGTGRTGTNGRLALALADAPACGFDAVNVTVTELRFDQSGSSGANGAGWVDIPLPAPQKINLLTLANGASMALGDWATPAGTYTQMRLLLAPNDASHPLANSVVPTGGVETALATPSAQQSGVKVGVDMVVPAGGASSYVIDIDACQSVTTEAAGQYVMTPSIQVVPAGSENGDARKRR